MKVKICQAGIVTVVILDDERALRTFVSTIAFGPDYPNKNKHKPRRNTAPQAERTRIHPAGPASTLSRKNFDADRFMLQGSP